MGFGFEEIDFINAVKEKNFKAVKLFIQGGKNINSIDRHGASGVFYAAQTESPDMLKYLIGAGAEILITDNSKRTPLHYAAAANNYKAVLFLLQKGANPEWKDNFERDVLSTYLKNGKEENLKIVEVLIEAGADVNSRDADRRTPLIYAVKNNFYESAKTLLKKGSSTIAKDYAGKTALDYAYEAYQENPDNPELFELISEHTVKAKENLN